MTALLLLASCLGSSSAWADISGGSGRPISPYHNIALNKQAIADMKRYASSKKYALQIFFPHSDDFIGKAEDIGFAYIKSGKIEGSVRYNLSGSDEKGKKLEIDLSEVTQFEVLGKEGNFLVLEIERFPAITPEELLSKKPTYLELRSKYRKLVVLRIPSKTQKGADLYLIGTMEGQKQLPITSVENIAQGRAIRLYNYLNDAKTFWWAIPSVYSDPAYPYREFFVD
jgi:hypothetical protein